ncbi:Methionine aminopeptidase 2 [Stygiomarasmius scandens]|uniref:Methionine aminopeptidase 2 n=2 Tax=Marasmiellus scandens TaxID=2682957 RepID=A0ABR1K1Y3_9AGAR
MGSVADPTDESMREQISQEIDVDDNDDIEEVNNADPSGSAKKKKKKKKPKKKRVEQSDPPRIPLSKIYTDGNYPEGEIQPYKDDNVWRTTSEEKRYTERMVDQNPEETYQSIRKGGEVHRLVRQHARKHIRPGMSLKEIAENIEDGVRALVEENGLEAGIAFPTGLNLNHCAAHYSPKSLDTTVVSQGDVLKVDFGVHVKGRILDSAFTMNFEPTYDKLLEAVKAATDTGIREAGIDARLGEIAGAIQETMESYEVEVNGKVYPVKTIENLSGHLIKPYQIHGDKSILLVKNDDPRKMEEGEYYAVETFGSTGRGRIVEGGECSHFAKKVDAPKVPLRLTTAKSLLNTINKNFGTLAFTQRYLDRAGESKYILALNHLISQGIVEEYPPLFDQRGSMTAQFEHTILLRPTVKEVVSRGDDY